MVPRGNHEAGIEIEWKQIIRIARGGEIVLRIVKTAYLLEE